MQCVITILPLTQYKQRHDAHAGQYNGSSTLWFLMSVFACFYQDANEPGSLHFGVHVSNLTSKANPVPKVLEMLLMHVEINGLYSEGIYRKSGSTCRARELHQILETSKSLLLDCSWLQTRQEMCPKIDVGNPSSMDKSKFLIEHVSFFLFPSLYLCHWFGACHTKMYMPIIS